MSEEMKLVEYVGSMAECLEPGTGIWQKGVPRSLDVSRANYVVKNHPHFRFVEPAPEPKPSKKRETE